MKYHEIKQAITLAENLSIERLLRLARKERDTKKREILGLAFRFKVKEIAQNQ